MCETGFRVGNNSTHTRTRRGFCTLSRLGSKISVCLECVKFSRPSFHKYQLSLSDCKHKITYRPYVSYRSSLPTCSGLILIILSFRHGITQNACGWLIIFHSTITLPQTQWYDVLHSLVPIFSWDLPLYIHRAVAYSFISYSICKTEGPLGHLLPKSSYLMERTPDTMLLQTLAS